jgi:hypothetical protein
MTTEPPPPFTPDQLAAHALLSELRTRIATQPLPYQHGVETRALESLRDVFQLTRQAMKDHPGCAAFASIATKMLNLDLRPVTAKWHKAVNAGEMLRRLAGVKVQHGRKQEGPQYWGPSCLSRFIPEGPRQTAVLTGFGVTGAWSQRA